MLGPTEISESDRVWGWQSSATDSCHGGDTDRVTDTESSEVSELSEADEEELLVAKELQKAEADVAKPHGFIIVRSDKGRMRRLHFHGGCYRVPNEHYFDYTVFGDCLPDPSEIDARCKQCFRESALVSKPTAPPDVLSEVSSADEADSSSCSGSPKSRSWSPTPTPCLPSLPTAA